MDRRLGVTLTTNWCADAGKPFSPVVRDDLIVDVIEVTAPAEAGPLICYAAVHAECHRSA